MSRTLRYVLTGFVCSGLLVAGAGAAFADSASGDDHGKPHGQTQQPAPPSDDTASGGGVPLSTDTLRGALERLGIGL